jgi:hypothetical protein
MDTSLEQCHAANQVPAVRNGDCCCGTVPRLPARCRVITCVVAMSHLPWVAAAQDRDAAALKRFERDVRDYAALHHRVAQTVPAVGISDDVHGIRVAVDRLRTAILDVRRTAAQGNIFTPDVAAVFIRHIRQSLAASGYTSTDLLEEINDEAEPSAARAIVNRRFPWERGSLMLPSVLAVLPPLPQGLQYRFVDRDLVLVDIDADLVVDIVPAVIADK